MHSMWEQRSVIVLVRMLREMQRMNLIQVTWPQQLAYTLGKNSDIREHHRIHLKLIPQFAFCSSFDETQICQLLAD